MANKTVNNKVDPGIIINKTGNPGEILSKPPAVNTSIDPQFSSKPKTVIVQPKVNTNTTVKPTPPPASTNISMTDVINELVQNYLSTYQGGIGDANHANIADVANSVAYTNITGRPTFAQVALTGDYTHLGNLPSLASYATQSYVTTAINNLVDGAPAALDTLKELANSIANNSSYASTITSALAGKVNTSDLSSYATTTYVDNKATWANISGKPALFSGSYTDLTNKPSINTLLPTQTSNSGKYLTTDGTVASWSTITGGVTNYNDLTNKPTIPAAQIQSDWTQSTNTALDFIKNKPTLVTNLDSLSDVTITSATSGQVLKYNGTAWINDTDSTGGVSTTLDNSSAGDMDVMTFDGNIKYTSRVTIDVSTGALKANTVGISNSGTLSKVDVGFSYTSPTNGPGGLTVQTDSLTVGIPNPSWASDILAHPDRYHIDFNGGPTGIPINDIIGPQGGTNIYRLTGTWPSNSTGFPITIASNDYKANVTKIASPNGLLLSTDSEYIWKFDDNGIMYLPGDNQPSKISFSEAQGAYINQGMGALDIRTGPGAGLQIQTDAGFKYWTFNANGNLTLPQGTILSETANSTTITPPNALAGQGLVVRLTGVQGIVSDHPGGFTDGDTITITVTPDYSSASVTGTVDYTFTDCTSVQLGRALTGTLTFTSESFKDITWTIPVSSTMTTFTITLSNASGFDISGIAPLTLSTTGSTEDHHVHLIAGNPSITDIYLGDDDQYVKIEKNGGNVLIGTNTNTKQWKFGTDGSLTLPIGVSIDYTGNVEFPRIISDSGKRFSVQGQGSTGSAALAWTVDPNAASQYAAVSVSRGGDNLAKVILQAQSDSGNVATAKTWTFNEAGNLTLPGNTFAINYANGTQVSLGGGSSKIANGNSNVNIANSNSSVTITANGTHTWTFDTTGNLIVPGNLVIGSRLGGGSRIQQNDAALDITGEGSTAGVQLGWIANLSQPGNVALIAMNSIVGEGAGNVMIAVGNTATTVHSWLFGNNGNLTIPGNLVASSASPAPSINGFNSANFAGNVSVGNISATNLGNLSSINKDGNASNILYGNGIFAAAPTGGGGSPPVHTGYNVGSNTVVVAGAVKVRYTGMGDIELQSASGTIGVNWSGQYITGGTSTVLAGSRNLTTSAWIAINGNVGSVSDTIIIILMDNTNGKIYRITAIVTPTGNCGSVIIETLI